MSTKEAIQIFQEKRIRTVWDDEREEWLFSIVDVIEVLTESTNPSEYFKKLRKREPELNTYVGTNCSLISMATASGKHRQTMAANTEQLFRIIQSIPSPKAEPFKQWMAQVSAERLDQMQDPELSINQAMRDYLRLGYTESWINQRLKSIEIRKQLTDEWKRNGIKEQQYASLTDIVTKAWSGKTTKEYKRYKGLHKENLRDNMTNLELILNSLAEASTTEISKHENPKGLTQNTNVAKRGGKVAKTARMQLESQIGRSIITSLNAKDFFQTLDKQKEDE